MPSQDFKGVLDLGQGSEVAWKESHDNFDSLTIVPNGSKTLREVS